MLRVFAWLVIYQGIPSKTRLGKIGLLDGLCFVCHHSKIMKHILWECSFAKCCWRYVEDPYSTFFRIGFLVCCIFSNGPRIW
jgi:hypothetical protein